MKGGGPFFICASRTFHGGKTFLARNASITAGSCRLLKSSRGISPVNGGAVPPGGPLTDRCIPLGCFKRNRQSSGMLHRSALCVRTLVPLILVKLLERRPNMCAVVLHRGRLSGRLVARRSGHGGRRSDRRVELVEDLRTVASDGVVEEALYILCATVWLRSFGE